MSERSRTVTGLDKYTGDARHPAVDIRDAGDAISRSNKRARSRLGHQPSEPTGRDRHTRMVVMGSTNVTGDALAIAVRGRACGQCGTTPPDEAGCTRLDAWGYAAGNAQAGSTWAAGLVEVRP